MGNPVPCSTAVQEERLYGHNDAVPVAPKAQYNDPVEHPAHYTQHPSGVECIQITEHMSFNLGNAVKYIWRADLKHNDPTEDLEKALWYIKRELSRISGQNK